MISTIHIDVLEYVGYKFKSLVISLVRSQLKYHLIQLNPINDKGAGEDKKEYSIPQGNSWD